MNMMDSKRNPPQLEKSEDVLVVRGSRVGGERRCDLWEAFVEGHAFMRGKQVGGVHRCAVEVG